MSNEYKPTYVDNTDNSISIMESTDTISFCKTGTKINTLSAKNVAHKKTGEDLNLCAFNNSNFNPVITVNNNHNDCRIMTNLNVNGNLNITKNLIIPTHNNSNLLSNVKGSIYFNTTENMYEGYVGADPGQGWQPLGGFSKTKDAVIHKNLNVNGNINCTNDTIIHKNLNVNGNVNLNNDTIIGNGTINTSLGEISRGAVPIKAIIMWSGTETEAQDLVGWALCTGGTQNGITIPDLRDRFIVGAGSTYAIDDTGGAATVALSIAEMPTHSHSITVNDDSHNHGGSVSGGSHSHAMIGGQSGSVTFKSGTSGSFAVQYATDSISGGSHSHTLTINHDSHNHTASAGNTGSGSAHENRPPYYALAYIIRIQ